MKNSKKTTKQVSNKPMTFRKALAYINKNRNVYVKNSTGSEMAVNFDGELIGSYCADYPVINDLSATWTIVKETIEFAEGIDIISLQGGTLQSQSFPETIISLNNKCEICNENGDWVNLTVDMIAGLWVHRDL